MNYSEIVSAPLIALRGLTLYPKMILHFDAGRSRSVKAVEYAMKRKAPIFLVTQKDIRVEDPKPNDLYEIGTIANVRQILKLPNNGIRVLVEGTERARLVGIKEQNPFLLADVDVIPKQEVFPDSAKTEALLRSAQELFEEYASVAPQLAENIPLGVLSAGELGYLADFIAQNIFLAPEKKQKVLETLHPMRRLELILQYLYSEIEVLKISSDLHSRVKERIDRNQKEYILREQLKVIQEELGDEDEVSEAQRYMDRIEALNLPEEHTLKLMGEVKRLSKMQSISPESGVIRTYLDTVLDLPWNTSTKERLSVESARKILDRDHYGLEKVKERILEFVAVRKMKPDAKGQVLCLVGPPGVGKTSVGMSVAHALNRKFARLSLGGVRDEADIRGHRKTYIGAMPGRIMTALRQAGSSNALILLDEVDKLGNDMRGDPSSALLEVLDAEQNHSFRDHYIELPFDISNVLFVVTANTLSTIPRPLLDRMEVIELTSYTDEEKVEIARRHLMPKQLERHGLKKSQFKVDDNAIRRIISEYTRESGVRNLERELAKCCRKAAMHFASDDTAKRITLTASQVPEYLGVQKYKRDNVETQDEVGVVNGLAWTSVGGELLQAEVNVTEGTGKLELTGNLGQVMKESAQAALSYIRSHASLYGLASDFYKNIDVHIHFPEGAVPKDGPSAGITVTTALLSALTGAPVWHDVAMTGEVTLRGRVLPIGGLKEKTMAAYRAGIKRVIIPKDNVCDLEEIDKTVRRELTFIPVSRVDKVIETALDFSRAVPPECITSRETAERVVTVEPMKKETRIGAIN